MKELKADVWQKMMVYIHDKIKSEQDIFKMTIAKDMDITYSHIVKILKILQDKGYVDFRKEGRRVFVTLTKKGKLLSYHCEEIIKVVD